MLENKVLRRLSNFSQEQKLIVNIETSSVEQSLCRVQSKAGTSQDLQKLKVQKHCQAENQLLRVQPSAS